MTSATLVGGIKRAPVDCLITTSNMADYIYVFGRWGTKRTLEPYGGTWGPTRSQLCNKLRSVVNIAPIHTRKAAIDSSHRDLRVAIFKPNFCFQSQCVHVLVIIVLLRAFRKERKNRLGRRDNLCFLWVSLLCLRHNCKHMTLHLWVITTLLLACC